MNDVLIKLANFLNSDLVWLYFIIVVIVFYVIIALITWNPRKPLIFLSVPSILVGIVLIGIRIIPNIISLDNSIIIVLNSIIKPLFITGIICIISGIMMIIIYKVIENIEKKKKEENTIYDNF